MMLNRMSCGDERETEHPADAHCDSLEHFAPSEIRLIVAHRTRSLARSSGVLLSPPCLDRAPSRSCLTSILSFVTVGALMQTEAGKNFDVIVVGSGASGGW